MSGDTIEVRVLDTSDGGALERVAPGVFDGPLLPDLVHEFLADSHHHLAVAIDDSLVVGMASPVHYVHPDKPAELWINEVGVAVSHRRTGLGKRLLRSLFKHRVELGCRDAWVLTDQENEAAQRLYSDLGGARQSKTEMYVFQLTDNS